MSRAARGLNSSPRVPLRVLVGGTYLEASTGLLVRVLDSKRSKIGNTGFVVESATPSRPGERWLCAESDLEEARDRAQGGLR